MIEIRQGVFTCFLGGGPEITHFPGLNGRVKMLGQVCRSHPTPPGGAPGGSKNALSGANVPGQGIYPAQDTPVGGHGGLKNDDFA